MTERRYIIDQLTIDRIMDAAQIVDVVSQFVSLKRRGVNYIGLCPFHSDKSPSFYVSPSKNICKCFACGEGGSAVHFIMKHEQLSYVEALKFLADKYHIEVQEKELTKEEKAVQNERESLFIINEYAKNYFINILENHLEGKSVGLSYFKERGFRTDIIKKFQLGYSLEEKDAFSQNALKQGYNKSYLVKSGLTIEGENYIVDRFRGRVIFPIHTLAGRVVGFGGRILKKAENTGKYVNSPESSIYSKSRELYGLYFAKQAITKADKCFLVEGYTDVISMHQAGIENVVASSGTALTLGQIKLIHRFTPNVTVLYDGDTAGIKAALRGIDLLLGEGMNIKVVLLPDGEDPDSFSRKQNAESFNQFIKDNEVDFINFKSQVLLKEAGNDPIKKANLIADVVESIAVIPNDLYRSVFIKDCTNLWQMDERVISRAVDRKRLELMDKIPQEEIEEKSFSESDLKTWGLDINKNQFDRFERDILYYIVRYGSDYLVDHHDEQAMLEAGDAADIKVIGYVQWDLERDGIEFSNELYKQIFEEAVTNFQLNENFEPAKYFLAHPNAAISLIAADLLSNKYQYSKIHLKKFGADAKMEDTPLDQRKNLIRSVPWVTTELKLAHIDQKITDVKTQLATVKDSDVMFQLLEEYKTYKEMKNTLDKVLGERVVLK